MLTSTAKAAGLTCVRGSASTRALRARRSARRRIGLGQWLSSPAIAAAPDGRVLVAFSDGTSQRVAERAPGGAFAPTVSVGDARDSSITATLLTLGAGGEAVVAWARYARGDVQFATRVGAGPFRAPSRSAPHSCPRASIRSTRRGRSSPRSSMASGGGSYEAAYTDLVLTGDGRAALAWFESGSTTVPALLTTPLTGGAVTRAPGGRGIQSPQTLRALTLADGTPALAWTEPGSGSNFVLHVAAEGVVERPDPQVPRVTIGAPRITHALRGGAAAAAGALRPAVRGRGDGDRLTSRVSDTVRLGSGGSGVLTCVVRRTSLRPGSGRCG